MAPQAWTLSRHPILLGLNPVRLVLDDESIMLIDLPHWSVGCGKLKTTCTGRDKFFKSLTRQSHHYNLIVDFSTTAGPSANCDQKKGPNHSHRTRDIVRVSKIILINFFDVRSNMCQSFDVVK